MAKKRVHEIAKAQGLTSKELLAGLKDAGVEAKSAQSSVEESVALAALNLTEARPKTTAEDALPAPPNRKGGWYPDPEGSGRLRFWNKKRWTDDYMDAPGEAKPNAPGDLAESKRTGSGGPAVPEPPKSRGRWGGAPWWAWVLAAIVALGIISAIAGGDKSSNDSGAANSAASGNEVTPKESKPESTPARSGPTDELPLRDGDWRLDSISVHDNDGDFSGTARITYTGEKPEGEDNIFTVTLFKGGKDVAVLQGAANAVTREDTATVQLPSSDPWVSGPYTYDFRAEL
jgi:translation initiation factor IF-2-like protein/uncharacterized protein DUF2510